MELLKVTELFIDQCEGPNSKKGGGNSVPVSFLIFIITK